MHKGNARWIGRAGVAILALALMLLAGQSQPVRADDASTAPTVLPAPTAGTSAIPTSGGTDGQPTPQGLQPPTSGGQGSLQGCSGGLCQGWKLTISNQMQYRLVARTPTFTDNVVSMSQLIQPGGQGSVEGKDSAFGGPANMNFEYEVPYNDKGGYYRVLVKVRAQWEQGIYIPNIDCSSPGGCTFLNPRGPQPIQLEIR
jgi:hypothetical protein